MAPKIPAAKTAGTQVKALFPSKKADNTALPSTPPTGDRPTHPHRTADDWAPATRSYQAVIGGQAPPDKPTLRVVVVGFGKFKEYTNNPSSELARQLQKAGITSDQYKLQIEVRDELPVNEEAVDGFVKDMKASQPDIILALGVTPLQPQVETRPTGGRSRLKTDLPVRAIEAALDKYEAAGNPRTLADPTAQGYRPDQSLGMCNYMNYRLTEAFLDNPKVTAGFVHVGGEGTRGGATTVEELQVVLKAIADKQVKVKLRGERG